MIMRNKIFLLLILFFTFLLYYWKLNSNPAGFFADEASVGIDAMSILKSGRDRHGEFLPLFFQGFNFDNVSPYQVYLTVPFVGLLGLNEMAVRSAPVFWSIIEIIIFYLLLKKIIPTKFALFGTAFLSINPWHFHISRINMGDYYSWSLLTLVSLFFLTKAIKSEKKLLYILFSFFLGLATYSYSPARLITPILFFLIFIVFVCQRKNKKIIFLILVSYFITIIPFINFHINNPHSFQRIKDTVGVDVRAKSFSIKQIKFPNNFFNKYIAHYSDAFLYKYGDTDYPGQFIKRHSISGIGLFYPYQKWLILAGFFWLIYKIFKTKNAAFIFILFLLLLFPLSDSLTSELTPYATRSYLGVLPFNILNALGIYTVFLLVKRMSMLNTKQTSFIVNLTLIIIIFFSTITLINHFQKNPNITSDYWGWQYGPREIINYFKTQARNYDEIYMTGSFNAPEIFLKFYDPEKKCPNCFIGGINMMNKEKKQLFALRVEEIKDLKIKYKVKKTIYYPNEEKAFYIIEPNF